MLSGDSKRARGQENHDRERKLIYDYLDQDENIMGMVGCTWGPESAFHDDAGLMLRQQRLKGIAVVTDITVVSRNSKVWHPMSATVTLRSTICRSTYTLHLDRPGGYQPWDSENVPNRL